MSATCQGHSSGRFVHKMQSKHRWPRACDVQGSFCQWTLSFVTTSVESAASIVEALRPTAVKSIPTASHLRFSPVNRVWYCWKFILGGSFKGFDEFLNSISDACNSACPLFALT